MSDIDITVIFSSYNGEKRLEKTLSSLSRQDYPPDRWELLAMDNNSTDGTLAVLQNFVGRLPIVPAHHATPGKSSAINAAIERARGAILVFTDDDIYAEPDWLRRICECAAAQPSYQVFGGRIIPDWEKPPGNDPFLNWIPLGSTFAVIEDVTSGPCEPTKIWGPNTAVRRSALGNVRYREDIGPTPGALYAMGEDQDIVMRLSASGARTYRCAEAIVHHFIPASNVTEQWVQQRAERLAYGVPALFPGRVPKGPRFADIPLSIWAESAHWLLRAKLLGLAPRSRHRFWAVWKSHYMRGYRAGIRRYASAQQAVRKANSS